MKRSIGNVDVISLLVTDFGVVNLPADIADALRAIPRRKDREPDRRFKSGRAAHAWERRQNLLMQDFYIAGREQDFVPEPFAA